MSAFASVEEIVAGVLDQEAVEAVEVVYTPRGRSLRVTIDCPGGVRLDDCSRVHKRLKEAFLAHGLDPGDFRIEVESPGADRLLSTPRDFERFRGSRVRVKLRQPRDGRRRFVGVLEGADEEKLAISTEDGGPVELPRAEIESVRLHV